MSLCIVILVAISVAALMGQFCCFITCKEANWGVVEEEGKPCYNSNC